MQRHRNRSSTLRLTLLLALFILIFSSCSSSTTKTPATSKQLATSTVEQPVSSAQLQQGAVVYIALGASDAVGVGSTQPGSQGYVPLIAEHLPKDSHMIDLGISGIHLHAAMQQELPLALTTNPQLITIWLVVNDFIGGVSYDSYMSDLNTLLQELRTNTKARIAMANLPDLTLLPAMSVLTSAQKTQMNTSIQRWNTKIASIAKEYNVAVVDLSSKDNQLISHPEDISSDGFHPSPAGYVQLANYFWATINN